MFLKQLHQSEKCNNCQKKGCFSPLLLLEYFTSDIEVTLNSHYTLQQPLYLKKIFYTIIEVLKDQLNLSLKWFRLIFYMQGNLLENLERLIHQSWVKPLITPKMPVCMHPHPHFSIELYNCVINWLNALSANFISLVDYTII